MRLDGHDPRGQQAQPRPAQPADQVLGQHGQAFLQRLVPGQPGVELPERLRPAVEVGQHVGADLVLEQRLDPRRRDLRSGCRSAGCRARPSGPLHVVADLDPGRQSRDSAPR